jgi:phage-related minor tail protein
MLKPEEIEKEMNKDRNRGKGIGVMADALMSKTKETIQKKVEQFKKKINELIDKKYDLLQSPFSKAEILEMAKEALREGKKQLFDEFLVKHMRDCQNRQDLIFLDRSLGNYFDQHRAWKLIHLIITEKDLEKAAEMLPDIGISESERNAQIKALDTEIAALEAQIEKELKKV